MPTIAAVFFVEIHGIHTTPGMLGADLTIKRSTWAATVSFPSGPDSFGDMKVVSLSPQPGQVADPRDYDRTPAVVGAVERLPEVRVVRVLVNVEGQLDITTWDPDVPADMEAYDAAFSEMRGRALEVVSELCQRVNLAFNQTWIEPPGAYPRILNLAQLIDAESRTMFRVGFGPAMGFRVVAPEQLLDARAIERVKIELNQGPMHPEELLLAEAKHVANSRWAAAPERATLLGAIAVELRSKRVLREIAGPERLDMLELLLEHPRDWSMSAHGLFAKAIPTFAGVPASDEYRAVAKGVKSLFEDRNRIAHRGASICVARAREHLAAAQAAFTQMDKVVQDFNSNR